MLLCRLADAIFWAGRYLERTEGTARIVATHTDLFLDLPKAAGLTWAPLLAVAGVAEDFDAHHLVRSEEDVVRFLLADPQNPGALLSSLALARENVRRTRALFPREAWEILTVLHHDAEEARHGTASRSTRQAWLASVLASCQQLAGTLEGAMIDDEARAFFRLGQCIERADMTTRVLDVRAGMLLDAEPAISPYADVLWTGVLRAVGADHAYRRRVSARVKGSEVLAFLLRDPSFPRSVAHCLGTIDGLAATLPPSVEVTLAVAQATRLVEEASVRSLVWDGLHEYVDDVQQAVHGIHDALDRSYFRRGLPVTRAEPMAEAISA